MRRRRLLAASGAAMLPPARSRAAGAEAVDLLLVLAVDVSRSVDDDEARLQREGYRAAMTDPRVLEAIRAGITGAIAVAYVEWAGADYQRLVIPWTQIGSPAEAMAWAAELGRAPRVALSWTSISGGLEFARHTLAEAPFEGTRRVVDISGDGVNNSGLPVEGVRDRLVAEGITINGLPITNDRPTFGRLSPVPLDTYYRESVIGGDGAFLVAAENFEAFGNAVRRKLVQEIAGLPGPAFG